jgi:hypothetical protein
MAIPFVSPVDLALRTGDAVESLRYNSTKTATHITVPVIHQRADFQESVTDPD